MSPVISLPDPEVIESEASAWIAQVDGGAMSKGDVDALKEWIGRSPHHRRAFEKLAAGFIELGRPFNNGDAMREWPSLAGMTRNWFIGWKLVPAGAWALAAAVAVVAALFVPTAQQSPTVPKADVYYSDVGGRKTVVLVDGSQVTLNTNTRIEVALGAEERSVRLLRGEALFEVAKDASRPFRVYTQEGMVEAVGTMFSVRMRERDVEVLVKEGTVAVQPGALQEAPRTLRGRNARSEAVTMLTSGKQATFDETTKVVSAIDRETMERKLSWVDGILIFDDDPLSSVVKEVSRYTDTKIIIADPALASIPVGGNFRAGETQALLDALEKGFDIKVDRIGDDLVYLSLKT